MQLVLFENYQNLDPFLSHYFDYKFKKKKYHRYQRFFLSSRPTISCEENEAFQVGHWRLRREGMLFLFWSFLRLPVARQVRNKCHSCILAKTKTVAVSLALIFVIINLEFTTGIVPGKNSSSFSLAEPFLKKLYHYKKTFQR